MSFGKIFESTFTGSMVGSGPSVFAVWSYVIASTRPPGVVEINPVILASMIGATTNDVESALDYLQAEDPRSRSKDCDGKRLIKIDDFLYSVPTWQKYRDSRNDEERRAYNAEAARKHRAKVKASIAPSITIIDNKHQYAKAEAEAEAEAEEFPPNPQGGNGQELFGESNIEQKDRFLPKDWRKITKADQKKTKVVKNSPSMNQIGAWFGRREGTLWTIAEAASLMMVKPSQSEIDGMGIYYTAEIPEDKNIRRRDLATLLNNWSGELDRARKFVNDQAA